MKLFKIDFGWESEGAQSSIVLAKNVKHAIALATTPSHNKVQEIEYDANFRNISPEDDFSISEVPMTAGVVYTGKFCC